jgi:hypothetical protein
MKTPIQFPLPAGTKDPMPFKQALRCLIGGRHIADRVRIFRAWWNGNVPNWKKQNAFTPPWFRSKDAAEAMWSFKESGVPLKVLYDWNGMIPEWRKRHQAETNRLNAIRRWTRKKLKKKVEPGRKRPK